VSLWDRRTEPVLVQLSRGARVDAVDSAGDTALHYAVRGRSAAVVRVLLNAKVRVLLCA
jgi:ankyrin repeat protein